jgi:hypothetical protein
LFSRTQIVEHPVVALAFLVSVMSAYWTLVMLLGGHGRPSLAVACGVELLVRAVARAVADSDVVAVDRDDWLAAAVQHLRPYVGRRGVPLPATVIIRTSLPEDQMPPDVAGWCRASRNQPENAPRIIISSRREHPLDALTTILHELVHASDDCRSGHGPYFTATTRELGLIVRPETHDHPGAAIRRTLALNLQLILICRRLGALPAPATRANDHGLPMHNAPRSRMRSTVTGPQVASTFTGPGTTMAAQPPMRKIVHVASRSACRDNSARSS